MSEVGSGPKKLALLGGGNMGEALLGGLLDRGWCAPTDVIVAEPDATRRAVLAERYGVTCVGEVADAAAQGVIVAVKPQHVESVCEAIAPEVERVLSVAAGITIANIERWLARQPRTAPVAVARSMPNTPAMVGFGASGLAGGTHADPSDVGWARSILESVGIVEVVSEIQLDAVTGVSGSGPAYLFLVAEAMIDGGVLQGLPRSVAVNLVAQTIRGAGEMLIREGDRAATLRANVTSPGGTTAAGLRALELHGARFAFIEAVSHATARGRELGS